MKALRDRGVKASEIYGTMGKKERATVMEDLHGRVREDGKVGVNIMLSGGGPTHTN